MPRVVELVGHERDFKQLCDGLLKFEIGPLVQTLAASGADKGIDAEFVGEYAGVRGRWVFQYKFLSPSEALSVRRRRLRAMYCPRAGGESEFDREGVVGADAYALLTNVPVTVALVHQLRDRWVSGARRRRRPLVVWDPSRLNVLIKGHEHLAKSWTGLKEERCRHSVVAPVWAWIGRASQRLIDPVNAPLWPLVLEHRQRQAPLHKFSHPFEWKYRFELATDDNEIRTAMADPQYQYATLIAYPKAFLPLQPVRVAARSLLRVLHDAVSEMKATVLERVAMLRGVEEPERDELATVIAYALLESRWGYPMGGINMVQGNQLMIKGTYVACPEGLEPDLDALVAEVPHGQVPKSVRDARRRLANAVALCWRQLWYVVELGVDAEDI